MRADGRPEKKAAQTEESARRKEEVGP
jgi:hypothetical protein